MKRLKLSEQDLRFVAWGLSLVVCLVAFVAWGASLHWQLGRVSSYKLFPLFGLLAFNLMWSHYIVSVIRQHHRIDRAATAKYFSVTSFVVLLCICLHPGLLIFQLWRDGFGLPPSSYLNNYVSPDLKWAALLGSVSFLVFIAYELHRWFSSRPWWKFVGYGSDAAMLAIIVHSLALGSNLQQGWLRPVWYFYAVTYLASLTYIHTRKPVS
jgi:hypothetical protein